MDSYEICCELLDNISPRSRQQLIEKMKETNFRIRVNKEGTAIEGIERQMDFYEMARTRTLMDLGEKFPEGNLPENWWDRISHAEKIKILGIMEGKSDKEIIEEIMKRKEMEIIELEKCFLDNGNLE